MRSQINCAGAWIGVVVLCIPMACLDSIPVRSQGSTGIAFASSESRGTLLWNNGGLPGNPQPPDSGEIEPPRPDQLTEKYAKILSYARPAERPRDNRRVQTLSREDLARDSRQ